MLLSVQFNHSCYEHLQKPNILHLSKFRVAFTDPQLENIYRVPLPNTFGDVVCLSKKKTWTFS
jgi:hypothetical protein